MNIKNNNDIENKLIDDIILGVKDSNLEIKFFDYVPLLTTILVFYVFCFTIGTKYLFSNNYIDTLFSIGSICLFILSFIHSTIGSYYKLYFEDNKLVIRNKFRIKTIIYLDSNPKLYQKIDRNYHLGHNGFYIRSSYTISLHIKQDKNDIILNSYLNKTQTDLLINNFKTIPVSQATQSQIEESANYDEKAFLKYKFFLDKQEKIIGVKNTKCKTIIRNPIIKLGWLSIMRIILINIIFVGIYFLSTKAIDSIHDFIFIACAILAFIDFVILMLIVVPLIEDTYYIKISYPKENTIKINKQLFNYAENDTMIYIDYDYNPEGLNRGYKITIKNNINKYNVYLGFIDHYKFVEFINNLIFKEKMFYDE